MRAVVFRSETRSRDFRLRLEAKGVSCTELDFSDPSWVDFDYSEVDIVVHYPSFDGSSNHPLSLTHVVDNLGFLAERFPRIAYYPDPSLLPYYNDKYRQYLFLRREGLAIPRTIALVSQEAVDLAIDSIGFPMVLKNRFGAGGDYVFKVDNRRSLDQYFKFSRLNLASRSSIKYMIKSGLRRIPLYYLLKVRQALYPFLSPPLLAQEFVAISGDLKTVCRDGEVVEGHWRRPAVPGAWKMNIDGGGIGEWSHIPEEARQLSARVANTLAARWLNIDLLLTDRGFLVSEFSPVWHHYSYMEKDNFVYSDSYNLDVPLRDALNLEELIVSHLVARASRQV